MLCTGVGIFHASATQFLNKADLKTAKKLYGIDAQRRIIAWRDLIANLQTEQDSDYVNLESVNAFFNQLHFIDDKQLWGSEDYWATPIEFLGAKGGDCEDFSLAKYFTLRELGISDEKIRLIYVKATTLSQFHMVLAYYPEKHAVPLILDNIDPEVKLATSRPDLIPIYSFNAEHLWLMKERGRGELAGTSSRLSKWTQMRHRYSRGDLKQPIIDLSK